MTLDATTLARDTLRRLKVLPPSDDAARVTGVMQWEARLRDKQRIPAGDWLIYFIMTGRGWGKSLAGSIETAKRSETCERIAIVAYDFGEGRDICVEGESGLKAIIPDLEWNRSLGQIRFPSGARGQIYSAEQPESLRGPNNYFAWCDEMGKWRYQRETWNQLMFTMRKGSAQTLVTTTPRPTPLIKELIARPSTVVVRGSTRENLDNLSSAYVQNVINPYQGTTLGRQELEGEIIDDVPGALWNRAMLDASRVNDLPEMVRIVVAIDPAVTADEETSNEVGIVAAGVAANGDGYVLDDKSLIASPKAWANEALALYHKLRADRIVAEVNNGGDMVRYTLEATAQSRISYKQVRASRGKYTRAEPIAALYEQGRVHHVGSFATLEDQLCSWLPGQDSPDRLDALVWALTDLMLNPANDLDVNGGNPFGFDEAAF